MHPALIQEKAAQAVGLLKELGLDLWLVFARESSLTPDPCLELVVGSSVTWHSAFLFSRTGKRIAIVGRFDADNVRATGAYDQVISYDESVRPILKQAVERLRPRSIAVNYSESDPAGDGLTHGLWRTLQETFSGTPYASRFSSAETLVGYLRGRKSPAEVGAIRSAIRATERIFREIGNSLKPGQTERAIANLVHSARKARGLGAAWEEAACPIVNAGPRSPVGHAFPGNFRARRGELLHMDLGLRRDGYCSDLQRVWYFLRPGEKRAPDDIRRAWEACWQALTAGAEALQVGAVGWEVDAAARQTLVRAGYPEYRHALGHQLGRVAHDGGTLLGPRWERYGRAPQGAVEAGQVYTLELGVAVPKRGFIGLEEDVLVTERGLEWLSRPQKSLWLA